MATHWATETKEKVNHAKLCRLLYDGGGTAVRSVVDHHCPPATLAATLKAKKPQLQKLRKPKGKVLNMDQWNKLYPPSPSGTSPSTKDFDITLLFVLIRNICRLTKPATGWDDLPPPTDKSTEANLARIKYYRNKIIGHSGNAEVDDIQYEAYWEDISSALVSLGLDQVEIDGFKSRPLGVEDYFKLLKEWQLAETDIKDQLFDIKSSIASGFTNMGEQISQIQKSTTPSETDKLFHQEFRSHISSKCSLYHPNTRAWILEKVKTHIESDFKEVLVIQAGPGMGKSVLAARICQTYQDSQENQTILGACHFFQHNDPSRNNPRLMLQSVAWQLCCYLPEYKVAVEKVLQSDHMRNRKISVLSCTELFTLLFEEPFSHLGHESTGKLVVVIDALDECCNSLKKEIFQVIRDRLYSLPSWIRFVMTTRPPKRTPISSQVSGNTTEIDPKDSQNTGDLQSFFADKLKELPHLSSDQQQLSHLEQLVDLTGGFFLVASFVIDFLNKPGISLTEALEHFPKGKGITSVYEDYFSRLRDEITPHLKSEEGFYNMLDAVVKAKSPIEKNIFYDILGFRGESRIPDNKKKEAINLLHQLFPVENDHVSPFHKSVVDWLTMSHGDHDFVAQGDGIGVLASACYNALLNIKQEMSKKRNQTTHITGKEIYAFEFGFDYMEERFHEDKVRALVADPYVLCNMAICVAELLKTNQLHSDHSTKLRLSADLQVIYDEIKTFHQSYGLDSNDCIVPKLTPLKCLQFTYRTYHFLQIEAKELALDYLRDNHLPYHERETFLKLTYTAEDAQILPCNGGFFLVAKCNKKTSVKKYRLNGELIGELQFNLNAILRMSQDNLSIMVHDYQYHPGDDIAIVDVATMKKVTSYRLPNIPKSLHVFGSQPWCIVARCFNNKIYIVEGKTGRVMGGPCEVQQNEDVLSVSNEGHILLVRNSAAHRFSTKIVDWLFTDEDRLFCFPLYFTLLHRGKQFDNLDNHVVYRELFICNHEDIGKRIPIFFRCLRCRNADSYINSTDNDPPAVLFSESGSLLAFYNANSITVVNTSDGSLYASVCLYHNSLARVHVGEILYLSEERIVFKGYMSIFSLSFTGESRPVRCVAIEHVYFLPEDSRIGLVSRSSNNIKELWFKRVKRNYLRLENTVKEVEYTLAIEKHMFLDG